MEWMHRLIEWVEAFAASPYALYILFALAVAEACCFWVPPDFLMIAMCALGDGWKQSFLLAAIMLAGTCIGGSIGHGLGRRFGRPILDRMFRRWRDKVDRAEALFSKYDVWAVGIAGFTPIPYQVFAISSGVFKMNFVKFFLTTVASRGARFFLVATVMFAAGYHGVTAKAIEFIKSSRFAAVTLAVALVAVVGALVWRHLHKRRRSADAAGAGEAGKNAAESGVDNQSAAP